VSCLFFSGLFFSGLDRVFSLLYGSCGPNMISHLRSLGEPFGDSFLYHNRGHRRPQWALGGFRQVEPMPSFSPGLRRPRRRLDREISLPPSSKLYVRLRGARLSSFVGRSVDRKP
jgi:hypothetical protein